MAIIYVDSVAAGADDGTSWTDAYATIQQALTAWTTSDEIWVEIDHTETFSVTTTFTCPNSTSKIRARLYRVDNSNNLYSPPPQDTTTTDNVILDTALTTFNIDCHSEWYGLKFSLAWHYYHGNGYSVYIEDMEITLGTISNNPRIQIHRLHEALAVNCYFRNIITTGTIFYNEGTSTGKLIRCIFNLVTPTSGFIEPTSGVSAKFMHFIDCDLSLLTNNLLVDTSDTSTVSDYVKQIFKFTNCKLKSTYTISDGTFDSTNTHIILERCSANAGTNLINRNLTYKGEVDSSLAVYNDTGYQDLNNNNLSQIMTPDADCIIGNGLTSFAVNGIAETTGSKTFTLELLENYTTALTERECYMDLYYFDSATNAHHKVDTSTKQFARLTYTALSAGVGLAGWTGEPAGSRSVKLEVTVTVNKIGHYFAIVHLDNFESGKVVHVDPVLAVA